jgi:hypothetical protein
MGNQTHESAAATVERWQRKPGTSTASVFGSRMLRGEWVTAAELEESGASASNLSQITKTLKTAGYKVEHETMPGTNGAMRFRVKAKAARKAAVEREDAGVTHPQLGAVLTVRALALDERGELVVHLSNGKAAWTATITGHVG